MYVKDLNVVTASRSYIGPLPFTQSSELDEHSSIWKTRTIQNINKFKNANASFTDFSLYWEKHKLSRDVIPMLHLVRLDPIYFVPGLDQGW